MPVGKFEGGGGRVVTKQLPLLKLEKLEASMYTKVVKNLSQRKV